MPQPIETIETEMQKGDDYEVKLFAIRDPDGHAIAFAENDPR